MIDVMSSVFNRMRYINNKGGIMKKTVLLIIILILPIILVSCGRKRSFENIILERVASYKIDAEYFTPTNFVFKPFQEDKFAVFSQKGILAITDKHFNVLASVKLDQGKGPGEYSFISALNTRGSRIRLYDFELKRIMTYAYDEKKGIHYLETDNLDFSSFMGIDFVDNKLLINSIFEEGGEQYMGLQLLNDSYDDAIKNIKICTSGDTDEDLIMNMGWVLADSDYAYYVKIYQGEIIRVNLQTGAIEGKAIKKDKPIDMAQIGENAAVLWPAFIFDEWIAVPYNTKEHHLYCEFFDKELNYAGYQYREDITGIPYFLDDKLYIFDYGEFRMDEYKILLE